MSEKYYKYSKEDLRNALEAIKQGTPHSTAAKMFQVPRTTLIGKIQGVYPEECRSGVSTILTVAEENILATWIIDMGKTGFPITKEQLLESVALLVKHLKRPNKFTEGRPGRHWYEGFLKRHPDISKRMSENLTATRALVTENSIKTWFQEIQDYFESSGVSVTDPERIFNADETALLLSPKANYVLVKKGSKAVYNRVAADDKESLTVLITGSAMGKLAPPMIDYKYERLPKHIVQKVPDGWGVGRTESGWMTSESFFEYISNVFYPWLMKENIKFPVILYVDGHKSHVTAPLSNFCREKEIILISLLPNCTHILQPLDVGLFKSLKNIWKLTVREWIRQNGGRFLKKEDVAPALKDAFRVCGLCPFDCNNVDYSKIVTTESSFKKDIPLLINLDTLRQFEFYISPDKLKKFREINEARWTGSVEDKSLFDVWYKMSKDAKVQRAVVKEDIRSDLNAVITDAVIEFEDGLVLENTWENSHAAETNGNEDIVIHIENISNEDDNVDVGNKPTQETENYVDQEVSGAAEDFLNFENSEITRAEIIEINEENVSTLFEGIAESNKKCENYKVETDRHILEPNIVQTDGEQNINSKQRAGETPANLTIKDLRLETTEENNIEEENTRKSPETKTTSGSLENIPSPFKKALFWPEITERCIKKKKEKIPSVTTSEAWKKYYERKTEEKEKVEAEKEERKRKRLEKKQLFEEKNKKQKVATKENVINNKEKGEFQENDFVIVYYEGGYFPGQIQKLEKGKAFIRAMEKSGISKWKWPILPDEIWYDKIEIMEKIEPPMEVNKRGFFTVKEFQKYEKFVLK